MDQTATHLPLSWYEDGTPIFERGDIIRAARPLPPENSTTAVMYDDLMLPEHKHLRPEIRFNMVVLAPSQGELNQAWLGRSHLDIRRGFKFGRIIQALDSGCRVLLQRSETRGKVNDLVILNMQPLQLAVVPPNYETVLVNASESNPGRFLELQAREEKRNLEDLIALEGPGYLLSLKGNLEANRNYDELPIPRIHPGQDSFRFLQKRPLYEMLTSYPKGFDFIDPPRDEFFAGAV